MGNSEKDEFRQENYRDNNILKDTNNDNNSKISKSKLGIRNSERKYNDNLYL